MLWMRMPSQVHDVAATLAKERVAATWKKKLPLKDRFLSVLKTVCAKEMDRFARWSHALQAISERPFLSKASALSHVCQCVLLGFSIPCFNLSHFFFKTAYSIQQRELLLLSRECVRLGGEDFSLQFGDFRPNDRSVTGIYRELSKLRSSLKRTDHRGHCTGVDHSDFLSQEIAASTNSVIEHQ
jgi:hypothetical protein